MSEAGCTYCTTPETYGVNAYATCASAGGKPCRPCEEIVALDALIAKAKDDLTQLLNRHRELRQETNLIHEPIIHRLPSEISAIVFRLALSEPREKKRRDAKEGTITTPLTLGAVCRTWRSVAWESPYLWTRISIDVDAMLENKTIYLGATRHWLSRVGQLPLAIRIHARRPTRTLKDYMSAHDETSPDLTNLSSLINQHMARCQDLEIDCPGSLIPHLSGDAPILDRLRIASDIIGSVLPVVSSRSKRINFRGMSAHGVYVSIDKYPFGSVGIDWQGVTRFEGTVTSLSQCLDILKRAPQLVHCSWDCTGFRTGSSHTPTEPIISETIKSFTLKADTSPMISVLYWLKFPALTHLELDTKKTQPPQDIIVAFLRRSSCTLTSLTLSSTRCDGEHLITILKATHSLRELQLLTHDIADCGPATLFPFFGDTSVISRSPQIFLPHLEVLTIGFYADTGFPWTHVPKIFGPIVDIKHPQRRPLNTLRVIYDWHCGNHWHAFNPVASAMTEHLSTDISDDVTRQLLQIAEAGIILDLRDVYFKTDMLKSAMARHSIEVPAWYQVKEHNRVTAEHAVMYEPEYASSEASAEETNTDLEETDEDLDELDTDDDSDEDLASDASDMSYNSEDDLPDHVTGETSQMLFNFVEVNPGESDPDSDSTSSSE